MTVDYAEGSKAVESSSFNHRDIVLDPSLINMALLSRGESTTQIGIGSNLLQTDWVEKIGSAEQVSSFAEGARLENN